MGPFYMHANRNKRSLAIDLKHSAGKEAVDRLVRSADVLLYNVRPQAMERLGLGYERLRELNPGLIYAGAYGFGQAGPYAKRPAFDDLIQGLAGIPSLIALSGDGTPRYIPLAIMDRYVGVHVVGAVMGALFHKLRTGQGQSIEVPMFETAAELVLGDHLMGNTFEPHLGPTGYARSLSRDRHPFKTRDGYVCVMVYTDEQWRSFFRFIGREELINDPRYATMSARTIHSNELNQMLKSTMHSRTTQEWLDAFEELDIPATRLHDLQSIQQDPHLHAVKFFEWLDHPSEGRICSMRPPTSWSETPPSVRRPAPRIGEHSRELLKEVGFDDSEVDEMAKAGVVVLDPTAR
jgi:crotonobetainyl-CoA:carnitine CoA-transferase CaiB-like acyl-CoA transferase